ncbi:MAG TPA: MFS transporter [Actinomycetota bacterium]|nr:MFS transporter [Actinomycetota bacterium]
MTRLRIATTRTFRSLRNPNYRRYFVGQTISMTGTWMQTVGQMWLVLRLSGSPIALGVTTALQFTPILLFGMWGGMIADRFDKRKVLLFTQGAAALLAAGLAVATATGHVTIAMVYTFAFLWGLVIAVDNPTRQSFVAELVEVEDLANAVGLNSTIITAARTAGPALAGVVITLVGVAACFALNAASYLAVIVALVRMDRRRAGAVGVAPRSNRALRDALIYVWRTPVLRSTLLLMAVVGTFAFNFRLTVPLLAEKVFDGGAGAYGMLSAMLGLGTLIGALGSAHAARPSRRLLLGSALAFGSLTLVTAAAPTLLWAAGVIVPTGAASIVFAATANTMLQTEATPAMRGRVMALHGIVFLGSTPVGGPLVGWIAAGLGTRAAVALGGAATLAAATISLRGKLRREAIRVWTNRSTSSRGRSPRYGAAARRGFVRDQRRAGGVPSSRRDRPRRSSQRTPPR